MSSLPVRRMGVTVSDEALSNALYQVKRLNENLRDRFGAVPWGTEHVQVDEAYRIELTAPMPVFEGMQVLGLLDKGSYVATPGSIDFQPASLAVSNVACMYCGTRRERTRYILMNENGVLHGIGTKCGQNQYVQSSGSENAFQYAAADVLKAVSENPAESIAKVDYRTRNLPKYDTLHLLASARRLFLAEDDSSKTPVSLARVMTLDAEYGAEHGWFPEIEGTLLEAAIMRAEFLERPVVSDFDDAVRRALLRDENTSQSFRLIAAVPAMHAKMARVERALAAGDPVPGEGYVDSHFGTVGTRYTVNGVIVERVKTLESGSVLVSMRSPEGHRLTWFSSTGAVPEDGQHITLTGTVKAHNVYRNVPDTLLTRCRYLSESMT